MKRVLTTLAKNLLLSLGLTAAIEKNIHGSGMTALIISKEEINDIKKIVKSLKESGVSIKV